MHTTVRSVWCKFEDDNSKTADLAKMCPFGPNIGPNWDLNSKNCKIVLNEYEGFSLKGRYLAQLGQFGPNIGPNQGLNSKKYKFWLKIY